VPGKVPGSYATYVKIVDKEGNTIGNVLKTTVDPKGNIVHVKEKLNAPKIESGKSGQALPSNSTGGTKGSSGGLGGFLKSLFGF
jgi:hypothetical protein